ncbi:MAG TPA: hypothetical protein DEB39_11320 [Planctomycetaceae bacterium]|nr:hypothetical protein [Planctomycetaceae bacterium]
MAVSFRWVGSLKVGFGNCWPLSVYYPFFQKNRPSKGRLVGRWIWEHDGRKRYHAWVVTGHRTQGRIQR